MGGGAMPEEGGGGKKKKKKLDAIINVVPAIDLLSCCISFLLVSAVWTQVGRLQAQQLGNAEAPPDVPKITLSVSITDRGFVVIPSIGQPDVIAPTERHAEGPVYDYKRLSEKLKALRETYHELTSVTVAAEDNVLYDDLVRVIDTCLGAGLAQVSVTPAMG